MRLSIVVGLYNMHREIPRTLFSMSPEYQQIPADEYEIILVDNGSASPFDEAQLKAIASNVRYTYVENASPSPTEAINRAVRESRGDLVMVVIDGARMFSPGILADALRISSVYDEAFVYAPSLHLGAQLQNDSAFGGYDQQVEDDLLASVDWQENGYELFSISNIDAVPQRLLLPTFESNCFTVPRATWERIGGYHPGFAHSTGGGLANWELFGRYIADDEITPVLLAGEATFHQFHGGASTNQPRAGHPVRVWLQEYQDILGEPFRWPVYEPVVFGTARSEWATSLFDNNLRSHISLMRELTQAKEHDAAIAVARTLVDRFPHDPGKLQLLAETLDHASRRAEALSVIDQALTIAPTQAELSVTKGVIQVGLGALAEARVSYDRAIELDEIFAEAFFHRAHLLLREKQYAKAVQDFERALEFEPNPLPHYEVDLSHARDLWHASQVQEGERDVATSTADPADEQAGKSTISGLHVEFSESVRKHFGSDLAIEVIDDHALHGSFSVPQLEALADTVTTVAPERVLIVGGFLGLSTRLIHDATTPIGSTIVTVDPNLRHRVFNAPLDHARSLVTSDRVQFVDGFFGAHTGGGSIFDLHEFEPRFDREDAERKVGSAPVVVPPGKFDLVLLDADVGTELALAGPALRCLGPGGVLLLVGEHNDELAQLLALGNEEAAVSRVLVESEAGFLVVSWSR